MTTARTRVEKLMKPRVPMQKVIMVGEAAAGKTSLCRRYESGEFRANESATVGVAPDYVDEGRTAPLRVRYTLWDTAGAEKFRCLMVSFYRKADVAVLVYDVTNESSFKAVETLWRRELLRHVPGSQVILVGAKCDLQTRRQVSFERGKALAEKSGYQFFETSAVSGHNVDALFWEIAFTLARTQRSHLEISQETTTIRVRAPPEDAPEVQRRWRCCVIL